MWVRVPNASILNNLVAENLLTDHESDRAWVKIALLEPIITRMVLNMIKGTIKYTSDDWPTEVWQDMKLDDKADSINYEVLFENHLHQIGLL